MRLTLIIELFTRRAEPPVVLDTSGRDYFYRRGRPDALAEGVEYFGDDDIDLSM